VNACLGQEQFSKMLALKIIDIFVEDDAWTTYIETVSGINEVGLPALEDCHTSLLCDSNYSIYVCIKWSLLLYFVVLVKL
jgi:hypothetical protein